jgi:hypothetical protein
MEGNRVLRDTSVVVRPLHLEDVCLPALEVLASHRPNNSVPIRALSSWHEPPNLPRMKQLSFPPSSGILSRLVGCEIYTKCLGILHVKFIGQANLDKMDVGIQQKSRLRLARARKIT